MDLLEKSLKLFELLTKAAKDDTSEVASIAVCDGDSILMGKRRDNGRWTLPGGHLDKGEEKAEGAVRELFEEAGIKVSAKDLKYLGSEDVTTFTGKKKKIHAYKYNWDGERPTTKNDPDKEVGKWEWIECKGSIPTEIADNAHTPVDKNCVFSFLGLKPAEKKEISSAEKAEKPEFEIYKSNYGPKPMKLYNQADNAERKANRTGDEVPAAGPNKDVKQIAPSGRDTSKNAAKRIAAEAKRKSKFNPVKIYSKEEIAKLTVPVAPKKLAASELEKKDTTAADKETEQIRENKKKPEAQRRHKFKAAEWTHPNGHPRCIICGDEERTGGMCDPVSKSEMKHALEKQEFFDNNPAPGEQGYSDNFTQRVNQRLAVPDWQQSYIQHPVSNDMQPQPHQDHPDIPTYVIDRLLTSGYLMKHPKRGIIRNKKIVNRGDGAPLMRSEEGPLELVHYSPVAGLKEIDPNKMGTSGVKSGGQYKHGIPDTKTSFHYIKGTEPEDIVTQDAKSKYKLSVHPQHLYDLSADPKKLVHQAVEENQGAWNTDMIFNKIKQNGYKGIWAPSADHPVIRGTVQMFHPHPIEQEEVIRA